MDQGNAAAAAVGTAEGATSAEAALPRWDLGDLYPGLDSPELARDLDAAERDAKAFAERYRGRLAELDGDGLAEAVAEFERLDEILSRVMSYAQLLHSGDMADPEVGRFYQSMQERVTDISAHTLFFSLELNKLEDADIEAKLESPKLARYQPWIRVTRAFRKHQLEEEMERLLHERSVAGRAAWVRLYDETMAALRFPLDGKELTISEVLHRLSDHRMEVRRDAARCLGKVLGENIRLFAHVTNTLAKDKEIDDRWRHFPRPTSARNLSNQVEDEVVDALVSAVRDAYPSLSHRYYKLKAKWFGGDKLDYW